jgi:voltage-gated potassium channel
MTEQATATATELPRLVKHGNAYNIFILVLTIFSLTVMVLLLLPITDAERQLLLVYDNVACVIFLIDFAINLRGAKPKRAYFVGARGWLDLLGSIPDFGLFPAAALFRLFRLSRLTRIARLMRGQAGKDLVIDVLKNRSQYAIFITILAAGIVLSTASILVLEFESRTKGANITSGGDALWWGIVTLTTVGYGDFFPISTAGRITGVFVMITGVGIIGALASILASILIPPPKEKTPEEIAAEAAADAAEVAAKAADDAADTASAAAIATELANIRAELAALRSVIVAPTIAAPSPIPEDGPTG